jgi:hypothetical protein
MHRERELRETQSELERYRIEQDEWERALMQERVLLNEARVSIDVLSRDLDIEQEARRREAGALEMERERASNLQSVLEDFQAGRSFTFQNVLPSDAYAAKDHEIRQAVSDLETRYNEVTVLLAEFKHRALAAEVRASIIEYAGFVLNPRSCNSRRTNPIRPRPRIWRRN